MCAPRGRQSPVPPRPPVPALTPGCALRYRPATARVIDYVDCAREGPGDRIRGRPCRCTPRPAPSPRHRRGFDGHAPSGLVRIALFGAGRIGRLHARLLRATPGVDTVIISDVDRDRAADVAAATGIDVAESADAAFESADGVVIAAATGAHPELIRASIGR